MENLDKVTGLIIAIAAIMTQFVTFWLGKRQAENQEKRGEADDLLDFSNAVRVQGETWEEIVNNLRVEVKRLTDNESKRLAELEGLKRKLQNNQAQLDSVMEHEMTKAKELEIKLQVVTDENTSLRAQIVSVQGENLRLQTELSKTQDEVNELRIENANLRQTLNRLQQDVRIIKKQTGELKGRDDAKNG